MAYFLGGELTVKDIAECISNDPSKEGIDKTIRQIRHWTQRDVLVPNYQKQTGTGVPRVYDAEPTIFIAAICHELVRYGAAIKLLKKVSLALYDHWHRLGPDWFAFGTTEVDTFLQVAWEFGAPGDKIREITRIELIHTAFREEIGDQLMKQPISSILINMNQLLESVDNRIPDRLRNKS